MLKRHRPAGLSSLTFQLTPVLPFQLEYTAWALRRRSQNLVDHWDNGTYRRVLMLQERPVEIQVSQQGGREAARLEVTVVGEHLRPAVKSEISPILKRMFGLESDLTSFYRMAGRDSRLRILAERYRGL